MDARDSINSFSPRNPPINPIAALVLLSVWLLVPATVQARQNVETQASSQAPSSNLSQAQSPVYDTRSFTPSPEIRQATASILQLVSSVPQTADRPNFVVNVPSYNFAGILQELQNRNARFVPAGTHAPASARVVFTLLSDKAGLSQTVYLTE